MAVKKTATRTRAQRPQNGWREKNSGKPIDSVPTAPLTDHHRLAVLDELEKFRANEEPPYVTMLMAAQNYRQVIVERIARAVMAVKREKAKAK